MTSRPESLASWIDRAPWLLVPGVAAPLASLGAADEASRSTASPGAPWEASRRRVAAGSEPPGRPDDPVEGALQLSPGTVSRYCEMPELPGGAQLIAAAPLGSANAAKQIATAREAFIATEYDSATSRLTVRPGLPGARHRR